MIRGNQLKFGSLPSYRLDLESYDSTKLGLGPLMYQQAGAGEAAFAGPLPVAIARPMEASTPIPYSFPAAFQWSYKDDTQWDWIFVADIATAAVTRRLGMYRYNRLTAELTYDGFITVTFPGTSEAKTIRALRADYIKHTAGTVAVSGTAVTGTSTLFQTDHPCVGNRIGFGSTDPDLITQWYEISAIASDTGLTLTTNAGTISAGTPYVIEDLRLAMVVTSVTTSLGGLYLVKGLRRELFSPVGGAVPAATTVDSIRATYFLKDASTGTATVCFGASMEEPTAPNARNMWLLDTLANPVLHKHNIRAPLTVASGSTTSSFAFKTGSGGVLTGAPSQINNGRLAHASHGPGAGLNCIYFTTASRIYRTADVSTITVGSTSWLVDNMTEIPPGGITTYAATAALSSIEYSSFIDKFIVTTTGASGIRSYVTQYRTDGGQMDRVILADTKQLDQGSADATATPHPSTSSAAFSVWVEGGMAYLARNGTTAALNQIYAVPLGADWEYAGTTNCRIISPAMSTPDCKSFTSAWTNHATVVGGATGSNLGMAPQPFRSWYRTAGIADNSGTWTQLSAAGVLSGVSGASQIQFMAEFRMGDVMIPARLFSASVLYSDTTMSTNWQGSGNIGSSLANKQFGFRHAVAYGSTVPRLQVELFDAETGSSLGTDDSVTQAWTWEKSTNAGGVWGAYNSVDRANADTYLRIAPTSLADNIKVRAVLREY